MPVDGSSSNTTAGSPTSEIATESFRLVPPLYPEAGSVAYFCIPSRWMRSRAVDTARAGAKPRRDA